MRCSFIDFQFLCFIETLFIQVIGDFLAKHPVSDNSMCDKSNTIITPHFFIFLLFQVGAV